MLTRDELILISVALAACLAGFHLGEPAETTGLLATLPSICLVAMMFLSYLSIPVREVVSLRTTHLGTIILLTFCKMIVLPLVIGSTAMLIVPEYAIAMILMSGICSGSSSPYFGLLLRADAPLLVVLVAATSVVAPITLPFLVFLLGGGYVSVSPWALALSLALYILLPMVMAEIFRTISRHGSKLLVAHRKTINTALFGITNFAVFAHNSKEIAQGGEKIVPCFVLSCLASLVFMVCGYLFALHLPVEQRTSSMISFAMTNNILVIVLSTSFFGSTELLAAAMYTIPFFLITIPIRYFSVWRR